MNDPIDKPPRRRGRPRSTGGPDTGIRTLDRCLDVLATLSKQEGLSLTELSTTLDQPTSSVHRMLMALERRNMVEFDPFQQTWHVGAESFRIGSAFMRRTGMVERARPILQELMRRTGETTNLGIIRNRKVLFLAQVETYEMIRAFFPVGSESPPHASGIGKALLAFLPPVEAAALLSGGLERFTANTFTDARHVIAAVDEIRRQGYALDDEERTEGMRCIAAAAHDRSGVAVAGVSISGPVHRVTPDRVPELAQHVIAAARSLSEALGYQMEKGR